MEYGFTPEERELYYNPGRVYSSFGRGNDFIIVHAYDEEDNLAFTKKLSPNVEDGFIDLNIGQLFRDEGFHEGTYRVVYKFLRKLAGRDQSVFVDAEGQIYAGQVQTQVLNNETRYYSSVAGMSAEEIYQNPPKELFLRDLKYVLEHISGDRSEVVVSTQDFKNQTYFKNFREMNTLVKYRPINIPESGADGSLGFDDDNEHILIANLQDGDRGFTQNMVGGEIRIPRLFQYTVTETIYEDSNPEEYDDSMGDGDDFVDDSVPDAFTEEEQTENETTESDNFDGGSEFDYDGVCFHPNTKVTLSNGRQIPIKMMRVGMKVRTDKGVARVKKVIKSDRGFGDKMVKYKNLITTDHHPIRTKDGWFMSKEIGTEYFQKPPFQVWNLILDKHHTIFANNIVAASLGKWKTTENKHWQERFLEQRNRIKMLLAVPEGQEGAGSHAGYYTGGTQNNTTFTWEVTTTPEQEAGNNADSENLQNNIIPGAPPTIIDTTFNVDYVAKIVEVLDYNRIKVDISYYEAADAVGHDGADKRNFDFFGWNVLYEKNNIERFKTYMVCDDDYYLVTNENKDFFSTQELKRVFKLKQPLPDDIEQYKKVFFVEKRLPDHNDTIKLIPFIDEDPDGLFLQLPNLQSVENPINFRTTRLETHTSLLGSDDSVNKDIERKLISGSLLDVQVNTEFNRTSVDVNLQTDDIGFGNFVHFSSAERRVKNFKKKVELIEGYNKSSQSLVPISSSAGDISLLENKRQRVINSFDPFEHYMYYESSSYVSSSAGQYHDNTWPKSTSSEPYTLIHSTGSAATTWFDTIISSASLYDIENKDRLVNNLPLHVVDDTQNNPFLEFMDMTGQQFDEIWVYTKHITDINAKSPNISEGISKDIAASYAKSLGLELANGNDLMILPEYLLGKGADGSSKYETPQEQITEEIWKRLLNNLPFFVKSKGSIRCLKGILNCYGIPSTILRVREYGGPDNQERVSYEVKRKFTYALDFHASQYIKALWTTVIDSSYPQTIEFRFRTPHSVGSSGSMVIAQKENDWAIHLKDNGTTDDFGYLKFSISASTGEYGITSSLQPFYNDDMWSVMLTRISASGVPMSDDLTSRNVKYELTAKQYDSTRERIKFQTSSSLTTGIGHASSSAINAAFTGSGGSKYIYLGGQNTNFGARYSGSLMEYRLWSEPLSQSIFDNHVRAPKSYNGNTYSSSYHDLLIRHTLDNNINLNTTSYVTSVANKQNYYISAPTDTTGSANGFTTNTFRSLVDKEQLRVPNIGPTRRNATKIRIEDTTLTGNLSVAERREKSSQDFAPIDSEKVGIYFSPVDVINEDIMYSIADFNFDDYIGDPRDQYKLSYRGLQKLRTEYWQKYSRPNNFWDYLRILTYYDPSVFTQLKQWVPARSKATTGVLIEPNILERSKQIVGDRPEYDNRYYENAGEYEDGLLVTRFISGSKDDIYFDIGGSSDYHESEVNLRFQDNSGSLGTLNQPTLLKLGVVDQKTAYGYNYATASVTSGGEGTTFGEVLQPNISGSRLAEHNQEMVYFYSSSASASAHIPYSSSYIASQHQSVYYDSHLFRSFVGGSVTRDDGVGTTEPFNGSTMTKNNSPDGEEPVETTVTTPTTLITKEPGDSKLLVK